MKYSEKLQKLRDIMQGQNVDGFLIPRTDEYLGEFIAPYAQRLAWLTGFTGSAGIGVVLKDNAAVMSDGRYTIQLKDQVDQDLYELENSQKVKLKDWLKGQGSGVVIGYDPKLHTSDQIKELEEAGIQLKVLDRNLIDLVWDNQPEEPKAPVALFPEKYAGRNALDKIRQVQSDIRDKQAGALVLTMSDSIAWLLNIRGGDVSYTPVAHSFAIVPEGGKVQLFIDQDKISKEVCAGLSPYVDFLEPQDLEEKLKDLATQAVWLDTKRSSIWFENKLNEAGVKIIAQKDPVIDLRACKNEAEQKAMREAHIRDGIALVKFLKWFEEEAPKEELTEISVEEKLESFRAQAPEFKEPSFETIAGYGGNGAIVHYRATPESNEGIKKGNLLLLDSGAQYEDGTTDITRTLSVGEVAQEMKRNFTYVLKGHIALSRARFQKGTLGKELDEIARQPLKEVGLDYPHGTGHGVGCYLSVHEEAASIGDKGEAVVQNGMILSNEPGYYKEGEYGIRIENLILAQENQDGLYFDTITLVPYDKNLICPELLSEQEKNWINDYHARVYKTLSPLLDVDTAKWLEGATAPLPENTLKKTLTAPSP
ncbi:MAG: aminopeptidase P family protein [Alphaproteobacteria bacterium]|nr:aminopeptidase P family protein [Alphaproteobacteria bacterium]